MLGALLNAPYNTITYEKPFFIGKFVVFSPPFLRPPVFLCHKFDEESREELRGKNGLAKESTGNASVGSLESHQHSIKTYTKTYTYTKIILIR